MARRDTWLLLIIYLGFVSLGLPDGTFGVAWPALHRDLVLPVGLAGALLLWVTLLAALSGFSSGVILRRVRTGPVVLLSCALTGSALLLIGHANSLMWLLLAAIPLGLGAGAVDAGLNGYVARHYSGRHMNWLHACWGIGATCGPLWMSSCLKGELGWSGGYRTLGLVQWGLALTFLLTLRLWDTPPTKSADTAAPTQASTPTLGANTEAGWLSGVIFALYVATETTVGLWASTLLVETRGLSPASAGLCASAYYGSITTGRILVGFVIERLGNRRLVTAGAFLAVAGLIAFSQAGSTSMAALSLIAAGLGFAPIYPGLMHEVPKRFAPDAVFVVIGRQSGASYIGGALCPALAGWLASRLSLPAIHGLVLVGAVLLVLAIARLDRLTPTPPCREA